MAARVISAKAPCVPAIAVSSREHRYVRASSIRGLASSMPVAEKFPGSGGTITKGIPSAIANALACSGPPPPYVSSANSRGSRPRSTLIFRMLAAMRSTAIVIMPSAIWRRPSSPSKPRGPAILFTKVFRAASSSSSSSPPKNRLELSRPRTRLASVTVGSVPPRP